MWKAPGGGFMGGGGTWEPGKCPSSATDQVSGLPGLPRWLNGKESTCQAGGMVSIPGSGRFPLEEEMATHSSILAWSIPWTEEPGGPQSLGSQRVGHD